MWSTSELIAVAALLAVLAATFIGLVTMSGTREDGKDAEKMMNWRILLQALAVLFLIVGALFVF